MGLGKTLRLIFQEHKWIRPGYENLREGVITLISPESRRRTKLGMTPASTTHCIFSFGPSVR